ncbi:hypothetical protein MTR67_049527 [Solanum verrucosum]|uniref:Uncharacterized protein n=1 Tax=Solanum verrucosum TaxID=315347 RepID=A0AAF0V128_SOLVR|nr:hypothetical protein MTR67_049527 [Solanum verrucosum]
MLMLHLRALTKGYVTLDEHHCHLYAINIPRAETGVHSSISSWLVRKEPASVRLQWVLQDNKPRKSQSGPQAYIIRRALMQDKAVKRMLRRRIHFLYAALTSVYSVLIFHI